MAKQYFNIEDTLAQTHTRFNAEGDEASSLRDKAFNQLTENGLPAAKHEEYRYTMLSKAFKELNLASATALVKPSNNTHALKGIHLYFINGRFNESISDKAGSKDLEIEQQYIKGSNSEDAFALLNAAFMNKGIHILAKKGATIEDTIYLHHIYTDANRTSFSRNEVTLEENSSISLVETHEVIGGINAIGNDYTECSVASNARLNYVKIQDEATITAIDTTLIHQKSDSYISVSTMTLQGKMLRNNMWININGEHVETNMYGLYLLQGKSHVDNHTTVDHKMPNCYSNELYKGVLTDQSTGVFNGKIYVRPDAQQINAFQQNSNILLSDDANIYTKPQLEIWADDVKCSHGATVGQFDAEQLFYLRSRGIGEEAAKVLLLQAFASDVVNNIEQEDLKNWLHQRIESSYIANL